MLNPHFVQDVIDKRTHEILQQQNWEVIIKKLTAYAAWKIQTNKFWKRGKNSLPKGYRPEDFAMDAISKTLEGVRNWDPAKQSDLFHFLTGVVDSDISNLCTSKEHRSMNSDGLSSEKSPSLVDSALEQAPSIDQEIIASELEDMMRNEVNGDDDLELMLCLVYDDEMSDQEIAAYTSWEISKVYNLKKKLRRRISKILDTTSSYARKERSK